MNRPIRTCLVLVAVVAAACARAPEPSSEPLSTSPTSVQLPTDTPSTSSASLLPLPSATAAAPGASTSAPPVRMTSKRPAPPPRTTAEPPPPPPKPPDRWVLSSQDRRSLEQQTQASFTAFGVDEFYKLVCSNHDVCFHNAFKVDASLGHEGEDCYVDHNIIPNPLYEGGTVTWVVNNLCGPA